MPQLANGDEMMFCLDCGGPCAPDKHYCTTCTNIRLALWQKSERESADA